jgi:cell wall-active antibiotic response 4TMS protein YvqF/B-box zinc finger protein
MNCAVHTDAPATAYCRTCGKALCETCKRDIMGAVYCEPCLAARLHGTTPGVAAAAPGPVVPVAVMPDAPNPGLAVALGMIPGVGAMYNGQFLKAFIHVLIFALLIVAADHAGSADAIFALLICGFWFYMVFDAHKTAKAKMLGQPLPDFLGLDRLFGLHETQPTAPGVAPTAGTQIPPVQIPAQQVPPDNSPTGAIVLIVLGVIFLAGNFGWFHIGRLWPLILIGLGLWIAYKRTAQTT